MYSFCDTRCEQCFIQQDPFHRIVINKQGLCSMCTSRTEYKCLSWDELKKIFEEKIENIETKGKYDGLLMLSGGKDSAYLAYFLKKVYGLNILGLIIDINYDYPETFENAQKIAFHAKIPYQKYTLDSRSMRQYYKFLFTERNIKLRDFGQVCTFCGRFLIRLATDFAHRMNIPLVFSGHNPDQILLMGQSIEVDSDRQTIMEFAMETVEEELNKARVAWMARYVDSKLPFFTDSLAPSGVELVFPFQYFPYRPEEMKKIIRRELNWAPIKKFSKTYIASGCKLAKLWTYLAFLNKTNNYVDFEFSNQVRSGVLDIKTLKKFYAQVTVDYDELAELIRDLRMVSEVQEMIQSSCNSSSEQLLQCLNMPAHDIL